MSLRIGEAGMARPRLETLAAVLMVVLMARPD
jgi:hypothetical protein